MHAKMAAYTHLRRTVDGSEPDPTNRAMHSDNRSLQRHTNKSTHTYLRRIVDGSECTRGWPARGRGSAGRGTGRRAARGPRRCAHGRPRWPHERNHARGRRPGGRSRRCCIWANAQGRRCENAVPKRAPVKGTGGSHTTCRVACAQIRSFVYSCAAHALLTHHTTNHPHKRDRRIYEELTHLSAPCRWAGPG